MPMNLRTFRGPGDRIPRSALEALRIMDVVSCDSIIKI